MAYRRTIYRDRRHVFCRVVMAALVLTNSKRLAWFSDLMLVGAGTINAGYFYQRLRMPIPAADARVGGPLIAGLDRSSTSEKTRLVDSDALSDSRWSIEVGGAPENASNKQINTYI